MTRTELLAQLLDLHLSRSIDRWKAEDAMTSKFKELAEGIAGDLKNFDKQADELMAKREELRLRGEKVFAKHRESQSAVAEGLAALESALVDMEGSNSGNEQEGSGGSSETFPAGKPA